MRSDEARPPPELDTPRLDASAQLEAPSSNASRRAAARELARELARDPGEEREALVLGPERRDERRRRRPARVRAQRRQ